MTKLVDNQWIISVPDDTDCVPDNRGFGAVCFDKMVEFGDKIAQINAKTDESLTYNQILTKSIRVAMSVESMGIRSDDIVALCTYSTNESYIPILAAQFLGLRVVSLDPTLTLSEIQYLLDMVKPRFMFCETESTANIENALQALNLTSTIIEFGESTRHISFQSLLKPHKDEKHFQPKLAEDIFDTAFILFSSGTTGMPKGICLTHYGLLYNAAVYEYYYDMQCSLYYTSPYWISYVIMSTMTVMAGGTRVICTQFDPKTVFQNVEKYKVTYLFLAPSATYTVTSNEDYFNYNTASLKTMMVGGSTISADQINKLRKLLPHTKIVQTYGLTESAGMMTGFPRDTSEEVLRIKTNTCGKIIAGMSCKIVDPETNETVSKNRRGELLIKSKSLMRGYYNKEEETRRAFDEQGYLHTGDIGYFDEENYLYIVDRLKSMFKYKSWHVIPAELESILLKHPDVQEAVVFGVPHEEDGELPMAAVVPKPGSHSSEHDIIDYFNAQVNDRKKLRGGLKFVTSIPKTSTGKYNRRNLLKIITQNSNGSVKSV